MSLDIDLRSEYTQPVERVCQCCGNERYEEEYTYYFDANITHNLNTMADQAGLYKAVWRPEENGYYYAKDIIDILERGIKDMIARPEYYKKFNPENGWGSYDIFVPWLQEYLEACKQYPDAVISVSR